MRPDYDVIIVGGRPAGSTLAARLGRQGLRVLLLERAAFPSLPAVSCPLINASTLEMLDEIGADESAYAAGTPRIARMVQSLGAGVTIPFELPEYAGRRYAYAVDRARFDAALWDTATAMPTVDGRTGWSVTDVIVEDGRAYGVIATAPDRTTHRIIATLTIGADGRYSTVARKMNAAERLRHDEHPTSILYAYWRGTAPFDDGSAVAAAYGGEPGIGYLLMDSADGTCGVVVEGRSDIFEAQEDSGEALYLRFLKQQPDVWRRVQGAERVTSVRGIKRIGNLYRQAGGPGWALVGDALVQQDPLDGQGIYNAVYTAKALSWAIRKWRDGEMDWVHALEWYDETVQIRTYSMYRQLLDRVQASLYTTIPQPMTDLMARWMGDDPILKQVMGRYITRQVPAEAVRLLTPGLMAAAVVRGAVRDGLRRLRGSA
ncbi:MAG: FAD-dependent monooxygenase [Chloroflexi bacterium]|nr:FAD-dependent monooxygenase [Chloroflexota bacterium]